MSQKQEEEEGEGLNFELLTMEPGDVLIFKSDLMHGSPPNVSSNPRRIYYAQYSAEPILVEGGHIPLSLALPIHEEQKEQREEPPTKKQRV